jgi:hypothetical protein
VGELPFMLGVRIMANDWIYGLRYLVIGDTILAGTPQEIDTLASDWNWDREHRAYEMTPGHLSARDWTLDGSLSLRDMVTECIRFAGACVSLRYGSLAIDALSPPLRSALCDSAHTITTDELVAGSLPVWKQVPDSLANVADIKFLDGGAETRFVVNDRSSVDRFGPRRTVELEMRGLNIPTTVRSHGPRAIADHVMSRILGLWSHLTESITVEVSLGLIGSVFLGDTVNITEWLAPNQSRGRGWSSRKAIVIGREIAENAIRLECLAWAESNMAGFSPCVRGADITAAVFTAASAYAGSSDYSGSDATGYASTTEGTAANDYGVGRFRAGDRVELVERDNASPRAPESLIILNIDTAARTITFTTPPDAAWDTIIGAGGIVDLRYDGYATAGLQTAQKDYCWIADRATMKIGGTSDNAFRWVP